MEEAVFNDWRLVALSPLPGWLFAAGAVVLAVGVWLASRALKAEASPLRRRTLAGLRLLAALLSDSRTHGVAFSVVEQLIRNGDLAAARAAFLVAAGRAGQLRGSARRDDASDS